MKKPKPETLKLKPTTRGFLHAAFKDGNGEPCSIQESSAAERPMLWLGCENNAPFHLGTQLSPRMHLTREQVAALLPMLTRFVKTGRL